MLRLGLGGWLVGRVVLVVCGLNLVTFCCFLLFFVLCSVMVWCLGFRFLGWFVGVWLNMIVS